MNLQPSPQLLGFETSEQEWSRDGWTVSTVRARLDIAAIKRFLQTESSWGRDMTDALIEKALAHSLPFGLYAETGELAGFARVVSDGSSIAYLRDVFVLEHFRGKGLALWLVERILAHPDIASVRMWMLATSSAHGLYEKVGFRTPDNLQDFMRRWVD